MIHDFATLSQEPSSPAPGSSPSPIIAAGNRIRARWILVAMAVASIFVFDWNPLARLDFNQPLRSGIVADRSDNSAAEAQLTNEQAMSTTEVQPLLVNMPQPRPLKAMGQIGETSLPEPQPIVQKEAVTQKPVAAQKPAKVASPVSPEFAFYESLAQNSWHVPVQRGVYQSTEQTTEQMPRYNLQAASLQSESDARQLVRLLRHEGLQAVYSASVNHQGKLWYRVSVGPFQNVSIMNKAEDTLVGHGLMPLRRRVN